MKLKGIAETREVFVSGRKLYPDFSQKSYNHSPDGFNWGYHGSGCAQLALGLLLMATDEETAQWLHQTLKRELVAGLPMGKDFEIDFDLETWIRVKGGKVNRSNWEQSLVGKDGDAQCTAGFGAKCAYAQSKDCDCECGGENHGKAVQQNFLKGGV